jgi:hypothetical protein
VQWAPRGSKIEIPIKPNDVKTTKLRNDCEEMHLKKPEPEVDGWAEAEAVLAAAQQMPGGPELPRSRKLDNLDSERTSAAGRSEIRNACRNSNWTV